jgi:DNA-binding transcriptional ArsR family regulator
MSDVFAAVSDPTRRRILEALRSQGPLTLKALAGPLPMSRQAVTKHVEVLRDSGLVRVRQAGRERLHRIDPTPLRELDDWLRPYAAFWDDRLARLRQHLSEEEDR